VNIVRSKDARPPRSRRTGTFTGEVWLEPVLPVTDGILVNRVTFAPSSRTYWHRHEHGQLLQVSDGVGWVGIRGEPPERVHSGDVILSPPGEDHWHGSAEHDRLVHTSISLGETVWLDEVSAVDLEATWSDRATGSRDAEAEEATDRLGEGLRVRREVMGDDFVERTMVGASEFARPLQELVTEFVWGALWTREGLDRRTRSLLDLGMLTALNRSAELAGHVRGAVRNGCTEQEIQEALLQTVGYCGAPAALEAFRVAERVLGELRDHS
jgi:4-carboxymuconolactone decarboxylase